MRYRVSVDVHHIEKYDFYCVFVRFCALENEDFVMDMSWNYLFSKILMMKSKR